MITSYQNAVRKSNGSVLNKLLKPSRSLLVTPREEQSGDGGSSCPAIVVPPQHSSRVFVLGDYKDEMVSFPPTALPSTPTPYFTLQFLQVLSSTSIRNMLAHVPLHPSHVTRCASHISGSAAKRARLASSSHVCHRAARLIRLPPRTIIMRSSSCPSLCPCQTASRTRRISTLSRQQA